MFKAPTPSSSGARAWVNWGVVAACTRAAWVAGAICGAAPAGVGGGAGMAAGSTAMADYSPPQGVTAGSGSGRDDASGGGAVAGR